MMTPSVLQLSETLLSSCLAIRHSQVLLYHEPVSKPFFGLSRCLKLMVKQNVLLAVHLHPLGTGNQVSSPSAGQEVQWLGKRVLTELGLMSLDDLGALDECGKSQLRFWSSSSYLGRYFFRFF